MNMEVRERLVAAAPATLNVEFRGTGREYFRIWIVNLALSVLTLGIYSAWAKVRTRRYFYGNTFVAGHAFEYHASGFRILIGRVVAAALCLACALNIAIYPASVALWLPAAAVVLPWLAISAIRFNARNTSWRNVRFAFHATWFEAFIAIVVWPVVGLATFFLIPHARRVQDYFYINHHRLGGRAFTTAFAGSRVYAFYMFGFIVVVGILVALIAVVFTGMVLSTRMNAWLGHIDLPLSADDYSRIVVALFGVGAAFVAIYVTTLARNLAISGTTLEGGFALSSRASPFRVASIVLGNVLLTLATLGFYYPFARIRLARYRMGRCALIGVGDLDAFTAEALEQQGAIGEEIAGFFDSGFGL